MPTAKPQAVAAARFPKKTLEADAGKSSSELIDQGIAARISVEFYDTGDNSCKSEAYLLQRSAPQPRA